MSHQFASYLRFRCENASNIISKMNSNFVPRSKTSHFRSKTELDSHADSPVVGQASKILEYTGREVLVSGFTEGLGKPLQVPVVTAAVAYENSDTGEVHILVIHIVLYIQDMINNLIPPMMMRLAGLVVDECPKFLRKQSLSVFS